MKHLILWSLLAAALAVGCRKRSTGPAPDAGAGAPSQPSSGGATTPAPAGTFTPAPAVPADSPAAKAQKELDQKLASGNVQLQLQVLDDLVQSWVMSKGSLPKELEELVQAKMLTSLPTPPPGKRFVIDPKRGHVVLGN